VVAVAFFATDITARKRAEEALRESESDYRSLVETVKAATFVLEAEKEKLRESEHRFRALVERMNDGLGVQDENGLITFVNDRLCEMLGYRAGEMVGRRVTDFIFEDSQPIYLRQHAKVLAGRSRSYEVMLAKKDGGTVWAIVSERSLPAADGRPRGSFAVIMDISDRKEAEEALRKQRETTQHYLDVAQVMLVALNERGRITLINRKGRMVLGCEQEDPAGKNWFDEFVPAAVREDVKDAFRGLMAGDLEHLEYYENPVVTAAGEHRIIAWRNTLLRDDEGNIVGTLSSGEDITERKRAEEALRESEGKFRSLAETVAAATFIFRAGKMLYVNAAAEKMSGYTRDELLAKNPLSFIHPDFREFAQEQGPRLQTGDRATQRFELKIVAKNGEEKWFDFAGTVIDYEGGPAVLGTALDITDRKRAEEELRESREWWRAIVENAPSHV
jgi:PAS domain S-box-containing protein